MKKVSFLLTVVFWVIITSVSVVSAGQLEWTDIPPTALLSPRTAHVAVWTGEEMIIWGGGDGSGNVFGDGARYNPTTKTWTAMADFRTDPDAPSPRAGISFFKNPVF